MSTTQLSGAELAGIEMPESSTTNRAVDGSAASSHEPTENGSHESVPSEGASEGPCDVIGAQPLTDITVELVGQDGNAFGILARVCDALRRGGRGDLIQPFTAAATSGDYDHLLLVCQKYVHVA